MTEEEKYCETCNHIEMCKWTPISGCAFHSKYEQRHQVQRIEDFFNTFPELNKEPYNRFFKLGGDEE